MLLNFEQIFLFRRPLFFVDRQHQGNTTDFRESLVQFRRILSYSLKISGDENRIFPKSTHPPEICFECENYKSEHFKNARYFLIGCEKTLNKVSE